MKKFTDRLLVSLKPQADRYEIQEPGGLTIRVYPTGRKVFCYRYMVNKKPRRLTIGEYPALSLQGAREKHLAASRLKSIGKDPGASRGDTVNDLAEEYFKARSAQKKDHGVEDRRVIEKDVLPALGKLKASAVKRRDVSGVLDRIMQREAPRQANITLNKISAMFNFALDRGFPGVEANPAHRMKPPGREVVRERILSPAEIRRFWHGITSGRDCDLTSREQTIRALRLILVTGQRPGECLRMEHEEIDGDWWTIPEKKAKNGIAHRVYLTQMAKDLIGEGSGLVFPGRKGEPCRSGVLSYALRRLLLPTKKDQIRLRMDSFCPHDLRRTCATNLAVMGYSDALIDRYLSHKPPKLSRTYNRHDYDQEKREMAVAWEDRLMGLISKTPDTSEGGGRNQGLCSLPTDGV